MKFEFHEAKSLSNKKDHRIAFVEAQALWLDADRVEVPANYPGEKRFLVVGMIKDKTLDGRDNLPGRGDSTHIMPTCSEEGGAGI